jgi:hypothetical protein
MSNGRPIRNILEPVAHGLMSTFCERVTQSANAKRTAKWQLTHWDDHNVPLGYVVEMEVKIVDTGSGVEPPHRRAGDRLTVEDLHPDASTDS